MEQKPIETVCVVGTGFMGAHIGLQCAIHGYSVWLYDIVEETLERAVQSHVQELDAFPFWSTA